MLMGQFVISGLLALGVCGAVGAQPDPSGFVNLDIEAGSLDKAIYAWAEQTGYQVLISVEGAGDSAATSPVLKGRYTPEEALRVLLASSELSYSFVNARTVAIRAGAGRVALMDDAPRTDDTEIIGSSGSDSSDQVNSSKDGRSVSRESSARRSESDSKSRIGLAEIVVTATKREERVQDVPASIAVIDNEAIERRGLIGMEDYMRSIPGVNQIDNGPTSNAIVIRGITTTPEFENSGSGATVATYFNEAPITGAAGIQAGGIDIRPVDIDRIEVLRGPQGTAYGSSSLGGTLRIIPAKPKLDAFGVRAGVSYSTTSGFGTDNTMAQGVVNLPVVTDRFALRVVGYRYSESGFYRNVAGVDPPTLAAADQFGIGSLVRGYVRDDVGRTRSTGGRISALLQATDNLALSIEHLTQTINQDGRPVATLAKYQQANPPVALAGRVRGEEGEVADTKIHLTSAVLNYNLGWAALTSTVSWIDSGSEWVQVPAFIYPLSSTDPSKFKSLSTETRLTSKLLGRFQFIGGVYYEDVSENASNTFRWLGEPEPSPIFITNPLGVFRSGRDLDQRAIFGEVSYKLTSKLTATAGARFFKYKKDESSLQEGGLSGVPLGTGVPVRLDNKEDDSSLKANLSYKASTDSLFYASFAQGFRLGHPQVGVLPAFCDVNNDGLVDGSSATIESTKTVNSDSLDNYEIGGKFAFLDRRISLDAALYHIRWQGLPILYGPNNQCFYTANAGAARSDGAEVQATFLAMEGLRIDLGAGYTRAKLSADAPNIAGQKGDRLPGSPKLSGNVALQYDFSILGHSAYVRADSFYTGRFYRDLQQTAGFDAGNYVKIDTRAGLSIRSLLMEVYVRNLTNQDAYTWRTYNAGPTGSFNGYQMRPRTIGVQIGFAFE